MKRGKLRRMSTEQLDLLLQEELRKETPDEEVVLPILETLENREQKPRKKRNRIISIAAAAATIVLLITVVPKAAGANSAFDVLIRLTDSVLQFFAPGKQPSAAGSEYTFQTNNPGLQKLYDKVIELGVTDSVVPSWLPEEYDAQEIKYTQYDGWEKINAVYKNSQKSIVIMYKICGEISPTQYEIHSGQYEIYERGEIGHALARNGEKWTAAWVNNGVECMITADVNKDELFKIIDSIYGRG